MRRRRSSVAPGFSRAPGHPEGWRYRRPAGWQQGCGAPAARCAVLIALALASPRGVLAQTAAPVERVTFEEAIARAVSHNPGVAEASAGILRAEAVLQQVRAGSRPAITGNATTTTIDTERSFGGEAVTPRTQLAATMDLAVPLLTPVRWAQRGRAGDQLRIARLGADEARRQIAIAAGEAYLAVITRRRVVELDERSRDTARAHFELPGWR
ncbi:MAG: TolC family protein [Acidobacteria bacterium]|nr:TolC family protein [Acidobacteriota bacterium]